MHRAKRNKLHTDTPHIPFYKDAKVLGTNNITVSISLRIMILALVFFVLATGYALFTILQQSSDLRQYLGNAHQSRLQDQTRTDAEIDQLACFIVAAAPNDPKRPIIRAFRDKYHCPPYGKDPNFKLYGPPNATSRTPPSPSAPGRSTGSTGSTPAPAKSTG